MKLLIIKINNKTAIGVYCFVNKSPAIIFFDYISSYKCDMLFPHKPCVLTDHSKLLFSPCHQNKICSAPCIFICNLLHQQVARMV